MMQKINDAMRHALSCLFMGFLSASLFGFCLSAFGITWVGILGGFVGGIHSYHKFIKEENDARAARLQEADRQTAVSGKRTRSRSHHLRF